MHPEKVSIIRSFARTLTVCAYADMMDRDGEVRPDWAPRPGPGQDWFKTTPPGVPRDFWDAAMAACFMAEGWNRIELHIRFAENCQVEGHLKAPDLDSFGHELAMECMGTGCSWEDDHPGHGLELPDLTSMMSVTPHMKSKCLDQPCELEDLFWRRGWQMLCDVSGPDYHGMPGVQPPFKTVLVKG